MNTANGPKVGIVVGLVTYYFRWIPPGSFWMGPGAQESENWALRPERPQHQVHLSQGFWLGETLCPQLLWEAVMGENPSRFIDSDRPVEQVSWEDIQTFFERLEVHCPGLQARLPTEAQWEYAARAGTKTATYAGELDLRGDCNAPVLDQIAWYCGNSGLEFDLANGADSKEWPDKQYPHTHTGTRRIGLRHPNAWGLYDMLGNVWEWCRDGPRPYSEEPVVDPVGSADGFRILRGGAWDCEAFTVRAATRITFEQTDSRSYFGFRLLGRSS